jgi:PAS domain S-box-containing protein
MPDSIDTLMYEIAAKDKVWALLPILMAKVQTGTIVYCSQSAADVFGYDFRELIGQPVELLVPEAARDHHAKVRVDTAVPNVRPVGFARAVRGVRKDGSEFAVHVGLYEVVTPVGEIGVAVVTDLTGVRGSGHG